MLEIGSKGLKVVTKRYTFRFVGVFGLWSKSTGMTAARCICLVRKLWLYSRLRRFLPVQYEFRMFPRKTNGMAFFVSKRHDEKSWCCRLSVGLVADIRSFLQSPSPPIPKQSLLRISRDLNLNLKFGQEIASSKGECYKKKVAHSAVKTHF